MSLKTTVTTITSCGFLLTKRRGSSLREVKFSSNINKIGVAIMEFTFTFAEIINKIVDLSLLGMESFIAIWLFAAFAASAYPDSINLPIAAVIVAPVEELADPATDIAVTISSLNCKSLRKLLSSLQMRYSGMTKEIMVMKLLSKIREEELDISSLLAIV
jgi:hypothetical protein